MLQFATTPFGVAGCGGGERSVLPRLSWHFKVHEPRSLEADGRVAVPKVYGLLWKSEVKLPFLRGFLSQINPVLISISNLFKGH
jgi:hypothetical protein